MSGVNGGRAATSDKDQMGFNATWSMAVGGMVGGGIFSVLGLVISLAGAWAWVSLTIAGLIALATGHSYVQLAAKFGEGGGAFTFLREEKLKSFAGSLSWVLIVGYILTISVYAFTFGHYTANVASLPAWMARALAGGVVIALLLVNLRSVGDASWLEIITVWGKVAVLVGLALYGLALFAPDDLRYDEASPGGWAGALLGAASIFMAYEGFQLLTYDYDDIRDPKQTLRRALLSAIISVVLIYIIVALGAASLAGAGQIVEHEEVALAIAGEAALGLTGKILVSVAAAFSTASAINATLFATARLTRKVASDGELPRWFCHENRFGAPDRSVIALGAGGAILAMIGGLAQLVETASLAFLLTFAAVNLLAVRHTRAHRWVGILGALGAIAAGVSLTIRLAATEPLALGVLLGVVLLAVIGRPLLLRGRSQRRGAQR